MQTFQLGLNITAVNSKKLNDEDRQKLIDSLPDSIQVTIGEASFPVALKVMSTGSVGYSESSKVTLPNKGDKAKGKKVA